MIFQILQLSLARFTSKKCHEKFQKKPPKKQGKFWWKAYIYSTHKYSMGSHYYPEVFIRTENPKTTRGPPSLKFKFWRQKTYLMFVCTIFRNWIILILPRVLKFGSIRHQSVGMPPADWGWGKAKDRASKADVGAGYWVDHQGRRLHLRQTCEFVQT